LEAPLSGDTDEGGEALIDQRGKTRVDTISRFTIGALINKDILSVSPFRGAGKNSQSAMAATIRFPRE
jgi:hypothetical protein